MTDSPDPRPHTFEPPASTPEQPEGDLDVARRAHELECLRVLGDVGVPLDDVARLARLHKYSITRLEGLGKFPVRIATRRRPHYRASEVRAWLLGEWGASKFFTSHRGLKVAGRAR